MSDSNLNSIYPARHARLVAALQQAGLDALVLNAGPSLVYLTGLHFHLSERPVVAIFSFAAPLTIVLPEFEAGKAENLPYPVQVFTYPEDPALWSQVFQKAASAAQMGSGMVGAEPRQLRLLELRLLEAAMPEAQFVGAEESVAQLRSRKDEAEITAMRKAVTIAQQALQAILPSIQAGQTEREIAAELTLQVLRHGSDPEAPFSPIVAAGPNSANPHAVPGDRPLARGDLLIIDWGARAGGYVSDLTRTFAMGEPDAELARIASIVKEANMAARTLAAPGVMASEVDYAARSVIERAGYGKYFTHRTGHGIGLEGHEDPYIRSGNPLLLEPGMTFTIEPGIYIPGRGGVRVEDDAVITPSGCESLSDLPRELLILNGR
ncbi:MAG TPA: aminopeptidase P family protein [Anaerolineales bacterium]